MLGQMVSVRQLQRHGHVTQPLEGISNMSNPGPQLIRRSPIIFQWISHRLLSSKMAIFRALELLQLQPVHGLARAVVIRRPEMPQLATPNMQRLVSRCRDRTVQRQQSSCSLSAQSGANSLQAEEVSSVRITAFAGSLMHDMALTMIRIQG